MLGSYFPKASTFLQQFTNCHLCFFDLSLIHFFFSSYLSLFLLSLFFIYSGGLFNPALTFAVALSGGINPFVALLYFIGQISGGLAGAAFVKVMFLNVIKLHNTMGSRTPKFISQTMRYQEIIIFSKKKK